MLSPQAKHLGLHIAGDILSSSQDGDSGDAAAALRLAPLIR
jgi:hypothetical protein